MSFKKIISIFLCSLICYRSSSVFAKIIGIKKSEISGNCFQHLLCEEKFQRNFGGTEDYAFCFDLDKVNEPNVIESDFCKWINKKCGKGQQDKFDLSYWRYRYLFCYLQKNEIFPSHFLYPFDKARLISNEQLQNLGIRTDKEIFEIVTSYEEIRVALAISVFRLFYSFFLNFYEGTQLFKNIIDRHLYEVFDKNRPLFLNMAIELAIELNRLKLFNFITKDPNWLMRKACVITEDQKKAICELINKRNEDDLIKIREAEKRRRKQQDKALKAKFKK